MGETEEEEKQDNDEGEDIDEVNSDGDEEVEEEDKDEDLPMSRVLAEKVAESASEFKTIIWKLREIVNV